MTRFAPIGAAVLVLMAGLAGPAPAAAQGAAVQDSAAQSQAAAAAQPG